MALQTYWAKRDFGLTPEPRGGKRAGKRNGWSFVVQKHAASHLHYDFRLELDGVLLSWAVPKGPSFDPADKRLAVQTEDHPIEYGGFEGVIPKGQYGGGTVMLWDRGTWAPKGDAHKDLAKGNLKFTLDGDKLRGGWVLVRTRGSKYGGKSADRTWLLIKEKDEYAKAGGRLIVEAAPDSVASGRTLDAIAHARSHVWQSNKSVKQNVKAGAVPAPAKAARAKASAKEPLPGAKKAPMPGYVPPMLTTLVDAPPAGEDWMHEIKYDGYRMVVRIERGRARLFSRNEKEWTASFPSLVKALAAMPVRNAWLDGEVVVLDAEGRTSFQALQNALGSSSPRGLVFFAFDLMYLDGIDLRGVALNLRKRVLREIVGGGKGAIRMGPEVQGNGPEFFGEACKLGLEGSIAKRADSTYSGTRSREWMKIKCIQRQEMVVGGYTEPSGSRNGFGALLLGYHENGKLRYAGKVGTGFDDKTLRDLAPKLAKREQETPPFADPPRGYEAKGAHWIRPDLVAEIAFTEWSRDGALRHPSFQGLRLDKKASEVVREMPVHGDRKPTSTAKAASTRAASSKPAPVEIAGVTLSNPDKPYFPEAQVSKRDLASYYATVAPHLLPHIAGRPLSLVRCPDGWTKQCFYQKHADKAVNAAVARIQVPEGKGGTATYLSASTAKALVGLVQWGVIELHPWGSRKPRLGNPDRLIFDFDPDPAVPFAELVTAVGLLRTLLEEMALTGFLKTTGGKGLHVVVPIRATLPWDEAKAFTKSVADFMVRTFPDRFVATVSKEKRKGKILIDYLRNAEGATAIAPFAVRARANAPVSTPIAWDELAQDVRNGFFNVRNVPDRLARMKADPWAEFFDVRQSVTAAMRKRLV